MRDTLLDHCFSEEEVWQAIMDMPTDKAPGPDGYTGLFYRTTWQIIKVDIMRGFQAIWSLDGRSFYLVNQAFLILLRKKQDASSIGDFRPISLIHSFAKMLTKVLARRLAPHMKGLVMPNQSAFITTRLIHDNYKSVQLTAKLLHRSKTPSALLKVDIAKAFDTVNWRFLLSAGTPWFLAALDRLDITYLIIDHHKDYIKWFPWKKDMSCQGFAPG